MGTASPSVIPVPAGNGESRRCRRPHGEGRQLGQGCASFGGWFLFHAEVLFTDDSCHGRPGEAPRGGGGCACAGVIKNETLDAKHCRNSEFWVSSISSLMVRALSTPWSAGSPGAPREKTRQGSAGAGCEGAPGSAGAGLALTQPRCPRPLPLMPSGGRRGAPGRGTRSSRLWAEGV